MKRIAGRLFDLALAGYGGWLVIAHAPRWVTGLFLFVLAGTSMFLDAISRPAPE